MLYLLFERLCQHVYCSRRDTMVFSILYTKCDYYGRKGVCGARCFGGRCRTHRHRVTLSVCRVEGCGRGTASKTGFCPCSWAQQDYAHRMARDDSRADAAAREQAEQMEKYIEGLIDDFES